MNYGFPTRIATTRLIAPVVLMCAWLTLVSGCGQSSADRPTLVVYCAHDSIYSEPILLAFGRENNVDVQIKFDTETAKSLGLVEQILRERDHPVCDVFWNNEQLATMRLKREGLLEPYKGLGYARIPDRYKDADGCWTGFAARMRVWIVNTSAMRATPIAIDDALKGDLTRVAIAKPLYGTTRTHYTVLWDAWGPTQLEAWHRDWRKAGVIEAASNGQVKNLVASGTCALGLTDTDDFYVAVDEHQPVAMVPVRVEEKVICIPNTVAIIKGTKQSVLAKRLVDYLLSADTELALAKSRSRQIPLGEVDQSQLPEVVNKLKALAVDGYPLAGLDAASDACLAWLRSEYFH